MNKKWTLVFVLFAIFMSAIIILAYLGIVATSLRFVPCYDDIGHFVLFGLLAYFGYRASNRKCFKFLGFSLPVFPFLISLFAILEETLQIFSTYRTFSFNDLFSGLGGILTFYLVDRFFKYKK